MLTRTGVAAAATLTVAASMLVVASPAAADLSDVQFNTDVSVPGRLETVWVNASTGGTLDAWIDFNSNGVFDAGEQIADATPVAPGMNQITYVVPQGDDFVPGVSSARFQTSDGDVRDLPRELYDAPMEALGMCAAGTVPVPVSLIQNPSFESRTEDFKNVGSASTIGYAEHWSDSHPTGGQYHVFSSELDSGPAAGTQPVRAGADGYAFEGGHTGSAGTAGEGAVNVLSAALNPDATYVGFFSMAAGGYGRQGNGFMQFFGTNDPATGSFPDPAVSPQTPANTELLYSTPVVEYAGNGVRPTWQLNTFQLETSAAWPYLRVEVRNEVPANDATVAGQAWMNFDDFHMFECEPIQDFGDAPASYGTRLADDGPRHLIPGYDPGAGTAPLMLGSRIDDEDNGFPSADARGDDEDATGDEDGVPDPIVVNTSDPTTVTVVVTNNTDAPATLAGWIDLDGNGTFGPAELITVPVSANSGTADYQLVFPVGTVTEDTFARFRLFPGDVTEVLPTGSASAGEVEDYRVSVTEHALEIAKTSDAGQNARVGDVVTYEVAVTNTGTADFTADVPASFTDDLSDVLDDATWNGDLAVEFSDGTTADAPVHTGDSVTWSGPLKVGETAIFTYSVTLTNAGDGTVANSACIPDELAGENEACSTTETALPKLTIEKVADTTELPVNGGTVQYTVTVRNEGPGDATGDNEGTVTDDLSDVLDDGEMVSGSLQASSGTAERDGNTLIWSGPLAAGEEATITYAVTYASNAPGGDNILTNVACLPVDLAQDPSDPCDTVVIPGAALEQWKTSDPASGEAVRAGDEITYTLHFRNTGETAATVANSDDLTAVLDDAQLVSDPTTSNPALTVTPEGNTLQIAGSVPAGEEYTVTYTVRVNAFEEQGDHVLTNALAECDPSNESRCETTHPIRHLEVVKTSDVQEARTGDVVTYEITVTNTGQGDYTAQFPATMTDDLSDVLDDAEIATDPTASAGDVDFDGTVVSWSGPLAVGESVTIAYAVTVTNAGDHVLDNAACVPVSDEDEACDVVSIELPHVVASKSSDRDPEEGLVAGDVVNYTLSWTNEGVAVGEIDSTDDLSTVLDDADLTREPAASSADATLTLTDRNVLRIVGPIQPGETITVTYQVTVKEDGKRGDNELRNVLIPDGICEEDAEHVLCPPPVVHHVGELRYEKSVDPASGTTVIAGDVLTYTLRFENTGKAPVDVAHDDVLTRVLDDADLVGAPTVEGAGLTVSDLVDERFTVTGSLEPGQVATVSYRVSVKADGARGDDFLGNFLVPEGTIPDPVCDPQEGQPILCTENHVSAVSVAKTSNPKSESEVVPGQEVTYTLTFTNRSANSSAAPAAVDYTDHMVDVLDDADLIAGPTASNDDLAATSAGDTIRITGSVPTGAVYTVTYTVKVKAYDQQGDGQLGNVVAITGVIPVCADGSELCTKHPVTPQGSLPSTGVDAPVIALAAMLLLLGAGGALVVIGRRRKALTGLQEADIDDLL